MKAYSLFSPSISLDALRHLPREASCGENMFVQRKLRVFIKTQGTIFAVEEFYAIAGAGIFVRWRRVARAAL